MKWLLSPSWRRVAMFVCWRPWRPCNADACNDTIPLGINRLPLLSKEEWRRKGGIEGKGGKGREGKRNLSAACFAAIKTTEVELLSKRRQSNKEWGSLLLPSFPLVEGERSDLNMGALRVQKCTTYYSEERFHHHFQSVVHFLLIRFLQQRILRGTVRY